MTKQEKIDDMLAWSSLEGMYISPANERSLRAQFAAMSEAEVDERYTMYMKRRAWLDKRAAD